jgi:ATP-dependent Lon protease
VRCGKKGHGADLGRRGLRRGRGPPEDAEGSHYDDEDLLRIRHVPAGTVAGDASIAMFGNTNQPIDVMVQTGHLFAPMPDTIRDDMAFIDRLHFYLPGWEIPQMRNQLFTDHYGFVVDYLAEALRDMRKHNFTEIIDRYFSMGAHLNARDRKAVRKTVSGLMKILFPQGT